LRIASLQSHSCIPFDYSNEDTDTGSFIGGNPPQGVVPAFPDGRQKFFANLNFDEIGLAIFYSLDTAGVSSEIDMISFNDQVLFPSHLIHIVIHNESIRSRDSSIRSDVSAHAIVFHDPVPDVEEAEPLSFSKVGGSPFIDNRARVGHAFRRIEELGFRQILQFDIPHPRKASFVCGFPWDPGWLHVLSKGNLHQDVQFAFIIQQ